MRFIRNIKLTLEKFKDDSYLEFIFGYVYMKRLYVLASLFLFYIYFYLNFVLEHKFYHGASRWVKRRDTIDSRQEIWVVMVKNRDAWHSLEKAFTRGGVLGS